MTRLIRASLRCGLLAVTLGSPLRAQSVQTTTGLQRCPADSVVAITAPEIPLPLEAATAGITRFSFIAYGDTRGRHDGREIQAEHELVMESMLGTIKTLANTPDAVRFVLQSGDGVQNGRIAAHWNVSYSPLINRLTASGTPYFLSVGNHDVTSAQSLSDSGRIVGLCHYLAANTNLIPPEGSPHRLVGYPSYAFGFGNSWFIAFDSDIAADSAQVAWVEKELRQVDRKRYTNVVLFFHHPPFSSGPHGGAQVESEAAAIRARYMPLFHKYHVRLLLNGHEHLFEHWVEHYQDSSGSHRLDEIVSGGGGAPLYAYTGEPDLRDYLKANSAAKVTLMHLVKPSPIPGANPFHYVVVHVNGDQISVDVVGVDWGKGFAPYQASSASLSDKKPPQ